MLYFVRFHPMEFHYYLKEKTNDLILLLFRIIVDDDDYFIFNALMNNTIVEKTMEIEKKIHRRVIKLFSHEYRTVHLVDS
mmetsp:Transcript_19062/g.21812  ORF Transcript_19062/g.21812 Transcript_19062/m.21812 type:complete len:80 (-) Transcript_19062:25-264(-)